ncbi:MAG TPA: aldo/keto reductase [Deinococcales bacterium]|nr:aldo/keto reductase [Deinococcales bacterium]
MATPPSSVPILKTPAGRPLSPLGLGGSQYGLDHARGEGEADLLAAYRAALDAGLTHLDTATDYGQGYSERLIGRFLAAEPGRREAVFLASKANLDDVSAMAVRAAIQASLERLGVDALDLYYLHWPRTGRDPRPWMEGLEGARQAGLIRWVGVSNFSVPDLERLSEVGRVDACQVGYNLLWRFAEADLLPYCRERGVAVVAYSSLAHGILSGRYAESLAFAPGDQRWSIALFRPGVWPRVHAVVQEMKRRSEARGLTLAHAALRWLLAQPGVASALVSARTPEQVRSFSAALEADVPPDLLVELSALSDSLQPALPDEGNPFGYHP